jgi:hypothetical protein
MLHDPGTTADVWQRQLRQTYGAAAGSIELALAEASRILPLITTAHLPSAANNNYWPEMHTNMSIVEITPNREPYNDTPTPRRFGTVSPLDPQMFSTIEEHVAGLLGGPFSEVLARGGRRLPGVRAARGHALADALRVAEPGEWPFDVCAFDVSAGGLGRFFAHKFARASCACSTARRRTRLTAPSWSYGAARDEWAGS